MTVLFAGLAVLGLFLLLLLLGAVNRIAVALEAQNEAFGMGATPSPATVPDDEDEEDI